MIAVDSGERPAVFVLSCRGGLQGELGVVRSLGRHGLRVVIVGERESLSASSRYCAEFHSFQEIFKKPSEGVKFLCNLAKDECVKPVLFPTADPDLLFVSRNRRELEANFRLFLSDEELIENLTDKARFFALSQKYGLPTPKTITMSSENDLLQVMGKLKFPVILKPVVPSSWADKRISRIVDSKKAVLVKSIDELRRIYREISEINDGMVVQQYIPGRDDRLFSLHAYICENGEVAGVYSGQKIRTYPAYAGIGTFVKSVHKPELKEIGLDILRKIGYRGLALAQFKQHEKTGEYYLLEINPRLSSWNSLATASGVDLPYCAYCDSSGTPVEKDSDQDDSRTYLFLEHDLAAMRSYLRAGELTVREWLMSIFEANTYQYYAGDDLKPFWRASARWILRQFGKFGVQSDAR